MREGFRYSPYQFAVFRIVLGLYLTVHFAALIPYATELFSSRGALPDPSLVPTWGFSPNVLFWLDSPAAVTVFVALLAVLSLAFTAGAFRRSVALILWYGWACLLGRQPFISNPSIPFIGLLLLLCAVLPPGEPWRVTLGKVQDRSPRDWTLPTEAYAGVWVLMALGYSLSGIHKLGSPSWLDGTAVQWLVDNPLSRDTLLRRLMLKLPAWLTAAQTYAGLALELLFAPLALFVVTRKVVWLLMVGMHLCIAAVIDFADLTLAMLLLHLFTLDPRWFATQSKGETVVFYDGLCGLCDSFVQFCLEEDRPHALRFATLQGPLAQELLAGSPAATDLETVAVKTSKGRILHRSSAALFVLRRLGGLWWLLGAASMLIPPPLRDAIYRLIAKHRYRIFGKLEACRIPTPAERAQFLDT